MGSCQSAAEKDFLEPVESQPERNDKVNNKSNSPASSSSSSTATATTTTTTKVVSATKNNDEMKTNSGSDGDEKEEKINSNNNNDIQSSLDDSSHHHHHLIRDDNSDVSSIVGSDNGTTATGSEGCCGDTRGTLKRHKSKSSIGTASSLVGLDSMIESRRETEGLTSNVVHMEVPFGKPIEEVYDGVHGGPVLGSGIQGVVRLATHKATGIKHAVKVLDLNLVEKEEDLIQLREEIFIMCQLDHPNIVRLEEVYESETEIFLVQELCTGGELFDRLDEQPDYHYTEAECARLIKQMLSAVRYLHSKGIIHRDLKLENFLFTSSAPDSELKMIDFGLSKHFNYGEVLQEAVGTPYTVAPEVIRGQYDERCDIWAIGVISFLLVSGDPPFGGCGGSESLMEIRANILDGGFEFEPADIWDLVSTQCKEFIRTLLKTDPKLRPTANEAQHLPWLEEWAHRGKTDKDQILSANVVKALVNFKEVSNMRKLLSEVLSFTLLPEQIKDLRKEFEKLDIDGSGEISLLSLKQVLVTNAGTGSLGALTEEEVEDIFNAMRVEKNETTIRWHEFLAAGLSQCKVDERNFKLAFERLDNDHKGYVTLDDIMDMMGHDAVDHEDELREMWRESIRDCNCKSSDRITYENFVRILKSQTQRGMKTKESMPPIISPKRRRPSFAPMSTPPIGSPNIDDNDDTPLSMDNNDDMPSIPQFSGVTYPSTSPKNRKMVATSTSPTANSGRGSAAECPPPAPSLMHRRAKSRSFDERELHPNSASEMPDQDLEQKNNSNRDMYRSHRQMRQSVNDACKRFEDHETKHARDVLLDMKENKTKTTAGLVMRRVENKTVTSDEIKALLEKNRMERQALMEKAKRRSDRRSGRGRRKKTVSDISAMMGSLSSEELKTSRSSSKRGSIPPVIEMKQPFNDNTNHHHQQKSAEMEDMRSATVPGEFRRTNDPFGSRGKYAAAADSFDDDL